MNYRIVRKQDFSVWIATIAALNSIGKVQIPQTTPQEQNPKGEAFGDDEKIIAWVGPEVDVDRIAREAIRRGEIATLIAMSTMPRMDGDTINNARLSGHRAAINTIEKEVGKLF